LEGVTGKVEGTIIAPDSSRARRRQHIHGLLPRRAEYLTSSSLTCSFPLRKWHRCSNQGPNKEYPHRDGLATRYAPDAVVAHVQHHAIELPAASPVPLLHLVALADRVRGADSRQRLGLPLMPRG